MKYKIGDRVKIREDLENGNTYGMNSFMSQMNEFKGKIVTISSDDRETGYDIEEDKEHWGWTEEMIEHKVEEGYTELPEELLLKTPIGVMPSRIYEMNRIRDLACALDAYAQYDVKNNIAIMLEWTSELTKRLECLDDLTEGE